MKNIIAWILGMTKIGKIAKTVQGKVEGKKQLIASLVAAIGATGTILAKFGEQGTPYLLELGSTIEFATASAGWIGVFNAVKGQKIRQENAQIITMLAGMPGAGEPTNPSAQPPVK